MMPSMIFSASTPSRQEEGFRQDINGLRALAVIGVVLFHFSVPPFSGGFAGVDVFFVISGYLMTRIIVGGMERGSFSLFGFYLSCARRLVPGLLALCAVLLAMGWLFLIPSDYAQLGKHAAASAAFYSNYIYMDEEGYFDVPSLYKWLLHTWSLSVEWQFYIVYPILLWCVYRVRWLREHLTGFLVIVTLLSLATCVIGTPAKQAFGFYMAFARIWEMTAGGLVLLLGSRLRLTPSNAALLEYGGLAAILFAFLLFDRTTLWPGHFAILPVAGAALVLLAARQDSPITGCRPLQPVGLWSYSIYLWHWPLVVGSIVFPYPPAPYWQIGGIAAAILLGALSYHCIEQPARRAWLLRRPMTAWPILLALTGMLVVSAYCIATANGFPERVSEPVRVADNEIQNRYRITEPCGYDRKQRTLKPCVIGDKNDIRAAVWGDSHSASVVTAVQEAIGGGVLLFTHQCVTIFDTELLAKNNCTEFNDAAFSILEDYPPDMPVIVINRYSVNTRGPNEGISKPWGIHYNDLPDGYPPAQADDLYLARMTDSLCRIAEKHRLFLLEPIPEIGIDIPKDLARRRMQDPQAEPVTLPEASYRERNALVLEMLQNTRNRCNATVLPLAPSLCENGSCRTTVGDRPIYFDDDHLSEFGNRLLVPMFREALQRP